MAKRRAVGSSLQSMGDALQQWAQMMMQDDLLRKRQIADDERQVKGRKEIADYESGLRSTERKQASRDALSTNIAGMKRPDEMLDQDIFNILQDAGEDIAPTSMKRTPMTSPEGMIPSANIMPASNPLVSRYVNQRNVKSQAISDETQRAADAELAAAYGTKYEGLRAENEAGNKFLPDVLERRRRTGNLDTALEVDKTKQLNPLMIARAGGEAGAREAATLDVRYNPKNVARALDMKRQELNTQLAIERQGEQMKVVDGITNVLITLQPDLGKLDELSRKINTKGNLNLLGRQGTLAAGKLKLNTDAADMLSLQDSIALRMANTIGGNKGQVTENDKNAMKAILMGPDDPAELAARKRDHLIDLLQVLPESLLRATPNMSPAARLALAEQILRESQSTRQSDNVDEIDISN